MKNILGLISGVVLVLIGVAMIAFGFLNIVESLGFLSLLVYGLIALLLGVFLLFNLDKEDEIEKIKNKKSGVLVKV